MGNIKPVAYREWLAEQMQLANAGAEVNESHVIKDAAFRVGELVSAVAVLDEYLKLHGE